jgi:hypothetical protein
MLHTTLSNDELMSIARWALTSSPTFEQFGLPSKECKAQGGDWGDGHGWVWHYDMDLATQVLHNFIYEEGAQSLGTTTKSRVPTVYTSANTTGSTTTTTTTTSTTTTTTTSTQDTGSTTDPTSDSSTTSTDTDPSESQDADATTSTEPEQPTTTSSTETPDGEGPTLSDPDTSGDDTPSGEGE